MPQGPHPKFTRHTTSPDRTQYRELLPAGGEADFYEIDLSVSRDPQQSVGVVWHIADLAVIVARLGPGLLQGRYRAGRPAGRDLPDDLRADRDRLLEGLRAS